MEQQEHDYRFNLKAWLMKLPLKKRSVLMDRIINESGQSCHTIKRIKYMKPDDATYVRAETKEVICRVFQKSLQELENVPNHIIETAKSVPTHD